MMHYKNLSYKKEDGKDSSTRNMVFNSIIAAASVALLFMVTGYLKEGLIAAAASVEYEEARTETVDPITHDIDFSTVHATGSLASSWIYLPDTGIDYPMVQGPDNSTYLNMDAYGNPSKAGAIFINFANAPDMTDNKTVIFGHNMSDGTMFSPLHKYSDEEWGRMHSDAYVYMDNGSVRHYKLRYYLFTDPVDQSVYVISKESPVNIEAARLKETADIVYGEHAGGNLICLSTCTFHTMRTVVVFEEVDGQKPIVGSPTISLDDAVSDNAVMEKEGHK